MIPGSFSWPRTAAVALLALASTCASRSLVAAEGPDLQVEAPWGFTKQLDQHTRELQFVATTPALGDRNTWLMLVCTPANGAMQVYLVALGGFSDGEVATLDVHFDGLPTIHSTADIVDGKLLRFRAPAPRDLGMQIAQGSHLAISIHEPKRTVHDYDFSLQPNERALADIRAHCLAPGRP